MRKEKIYTIKFDKPVKLVGLQPDGGMTFDDGTVVEDWHSQDCCESVFADWTSLEDTTIFDKVFTELKITGKPELGIVLNDEFSVNCYNQQNGYYSSQLQLVVKKPNEEPIWIDISKFVKNEIY